MKNFSLLFICIIVLLCGTTSCSSDDDNNDQQEKVEFTDKNQSLDLNVGDEVEFAIEGLSNQKEYTLHIKDMQINYDRYFGGSKNVEMIKFRINKELSGMTDKKLILKHEGQTIAEGPSLTIKKTYLMSIGSHSICFSSFCGMSISPDNTVSVLMTLDFNPAKVIVNTALFKGQFLPGTERMEMERSSANMDISSIEIPNGRWGFTFRSDRQLGMTNRDGVNYISMTYTQNVGKKEENHYCILVNKNKQVQPFGGNVEKYRFNDGLSHICVDSKGFLYVVEWSRNCIYKLDPAKQEWKTLWAGSEAESASTDGTGPNARFTTIHYLTIDSNDNLYVGESLKIRKITPDGKVTTLAGKNESGDVVGDINDAQFNGIKGMAIGKDNSIYVLDGDNQALKLINPEQTKVISYPIRNVSNVQFAGDRIEMPMQVGTDGVVYFVSKQDLMAIVPDHLWVN